MPLTDYAILPRRTAGFGSGFGPVRGPSTPQGAGYAGDLAQWARQTVEKVRVATVGGRIRFLPWYDPYTDETPEIRAEYRKMLTESSVKAAFQTKILSVISLDVQCQAVDDDDPRQQEAARFGAYAFRKVKGGMRRVGWSVLHPAIIDGHSVCEKVWNERPEPDGPFKGKRIYHAVKAKDTRFLQLGIDPYRNVTAIRGIGHNAGRVWSPSDFIIFSYMELFEHPAGTSDFRAAYRPYWIKHTTWQLRGLHLDKFVGPYLKGTYTTQDQKDALEQALTDARATTWMTCPVGTAVEAIDMSMRGTADFEVAIKDCDREILIAIVGAHLQILEGQTTGGRGNTKVHKETAELIQWFLAASLADIYREQFLTPLIVENFHGVEVPDVSVGAVTEEAMLESLKVDQGLQALGWKLSKRNTGKRYTRPWAEDANDALAAPSAGAGGQGQQQPGGGAGASPFSEGWRAFCTEGANAGKPGPCPEEGTGRGVAMQPFHAVGAAVANGSYGRAAKILNGLKSGTYSPEDAVQDLEISKQAARTKAVGDLVRRYQTAQKLLVAERGEAALQTPEWGAARTAFQAARDEISGHIDTLFDHALDVAHYHAAPANAGEAVQIPAATREAIADAHNALIESYNARAQELDGALGELRLKAHGFAELRRFCTEGANKGKPGPCPEEGEHAAYVASVLKAHAGKSPAERDKVARRLEGLAKKGQLEPDRARAAASALRGEGNSAPSGQPALEKTVLDAARQLRPTPTGIVKIPELVDQVRAEHPGQTPEQVHALLLDMERQGKIKVALVNDPRLEPRAGEMIRTERGLAGYVYLLSEPRSFCTEGANKGKPGPCPEGDREQKSMPRKQSREERQQARQTANRAVKQAKSEAQKVEDLAGTFPFNRLYPQGEQDPDLNRIRDLSTRVSREYRGSALEANYISPENRKTLDERAREAYELARTASKLVTEYTNVRLEPGESLDHEVIDILRSIAATALRAHKGFSAGHAYNQSLSGGSPAS